MTKIERAVKTVSDLLYFFRRIPKITDENAAGKEVNNRMSRRTGAADMLPVSGGDESSEGEGEEAG